MISPLADAHNIRIFTMARLGERANLEAVLDLLAEAKLEPTHAGPRENELHAFDRAATVDAITSGQHHLLCLARRKAPRYTGGLLAQRRAGLTDISIEGCAHPKPEILYTLGDTLAARFRAPYAVAHPEIVDGTKFRGAGAITTDWLQNYGPMLVASRTWYGTHLTDLIGEDRIRAAGIATSLPWGGLRLDLVAEPWAADIATLKQRQAEAVAALEPAQVLGNYTHPVIRKPGARWVPIPEDNA
jgi:hypothetical protein